ncbi:MAG: hypothetical protein U0452_12265 [Anaerolineae bacterium]
MSAFEGGQGQSPRLGILFEVVLNIARAHDLEAAYPALIGRLKWVLDFDRCALALINPDGRTILFRTLFDARRGVELPVIEAVPLDEPGLVTAAMQDRQLRRVTRPAEAEAGALGATDAAIWSDTAQTALVIPLQSVCAEPWVRSSLPPIVRRFQPRGRAHRRFGGDAPSAGYRTRQASAGITAG